MANDVGKEKHEPSTRYKKRKKKQKANIVIRGIQDERLLLEPDLNCDTWIRNLMRGEV